jgi:hypothetical protein
LAIEVHSRAVAALVAVGNAVAPSPWASVDRHPLCCGNTLSIIVENRRNPPADEAITLLLLVDVK